MALLSKIKVGGKIYDLKDAKARQDISTLVGSSDVTTALGAAAWKAVAANISGKGLVDASVVKAYVDSQVGQIHSFDVVIDAAGTEDGPSATASADTMYKIYMVADGKASAGIYIEWITIRSDVEGAYTYAWEKIGSTKTDLTGYVSKDTTIATLKLDHNIEVDELSQALGLGTLAKKNSATGTVPGQTIKGVKATGTTTGELTGALAYTSTDVTSTGTFTPAGSVTGSAISGGSIDVTLKDATSATAANVTTVPYTPAGDVTTAIQESESGVQIEGDVSAPEITVTPAKGTVQEMKSAGTAYTITKGSVTKAADTSDTFAKVGIVAAIGADGEDAETLIFSDAATAEAVTASGGVTYVAPTLSGALPTFGTAEVLTGVSATASAPTFTSKKYAVPATFKGTEAADMKVTGVTYVKQAIGKAEFTGTEATLGFDGTAGDVSVAGAYDKANLGTVAFAGKAVELAVGDIAVPATDVTVK